MTSPTELSTPELLATHGDTAFTQDENRLNPGIYLNDPRSGHAYLVGTNNRSLTVLDLGGVISVAGLDIRDPDHLDRLADRLHLLADRLRTRATR